MSENMFRRMWGGKGNLFLPVIVINFLILGVLLPETLFSQPGAAGETRNGAFDPSNPFARMSELPYHAPAFDKIKDSDFKPAFEEGIRVQSDEIETIANIPAKPSFENTLVAMERSGRMLSRVNQVFNLLTGANTNPTLQKIQEEVAPMLAAHQDEIYLNPKLFKRVEAIYNERNKLKLDSESQHLIRYEYQQFVLAGARLSDAEKAALKKLNAEDAFLSTRFTNQLLAAANEGALVVDNKSDLAGLSPADIEAAAQAAKARKLEGKYLIPLQNTTQQPYLQVLIKRATREKLFNASWNRAEKGDSSDTRATILRLAAIRAEKARLLGYHTYSEWKLQDQMAKNPAEVDHFLDQLVPAATAKARKEAAEIQDLINQQHGGFKLQAWDWNYYAEQLRKAKYDLDEDQVKPYFELNNVLENGVFYAANQLYGLTFKERKDLPVYQEDVRVFEVFDHDGSQLGLFYCDYYKRDNKSGGAWMSNMVEQSKLLGTKPVVYNVCNFQRPASGQPALISFDDVTTMFHEFGHALHGLFANQTYPSLSGANVARDFVEFPSQFNEHWALYPKVFKHYALHYKTKQPMPEALIAKIKKASTFNQGYNMTELLAAARLDMAWHSLPVNGGVNDVDKFESEALQQAHLDLPEVPTRYRSSYFLHIWGNGYAAGYYAYLWTQMLDNDAYAWFEQHGGLTRENGQRFRDMILSRGNPLDYASLFRNFRGHAPDIHPMLVNKGLVTK